MNIINMESNKDLVMTSEEFLKTIINPAREDAGEKPTRHNDLVTRIEDELDDQKLTYESFVRRGNNVKVYTLDYEQLLLVGMRESKAVRRVVLKRLKEAYKTISDMVDAIDKGDAQSAKVTGELFLERERDNRAFAHNNLKKLRTLKPERILAAVKAGKLSKDKALELVKPTSVYAKRIKAL